MSKKIKIIIGAVVLILVVWGVVALTGNKTNSNQPQEFKLGVINTMTGPFGSVGENYLKGIRSAELVYEQKTGKKVTIVVENDGGDGAVGLSAYKKLTQSDKVDGMINFFTTTMDTIYTDAKVAGKPVMMGAFQANNVADDYVFQMTPGNDGMWTKYAPYIKTAGYDLSNFVLVHSKDAAQASFAEAFTSDYGGKVTSYTASSDKNGLKTDATKILAMKPTTIIFFMTPENGAILTKDILAQKDSATSLIYDIQLVTGWSQYKDILGTNISKLNGALTLAWEGDPDQVFLKAYHKLYGANENPGFLADFGYDTFNVYMNNYDKDNSKWVNNIKNTNMQGASGKIKFDKVGVRAPDLVVKKVTDGELKNIARLAF
jgi:ABC-type branched-subunit amino acid transport system substrate-binding protein